VNVKKNRKEKKLLDERTSIRLKMDTRVEYKSERAF